MKMRSAVRRSSPDADVPRRFEPRVADVDLSVGKCRGAIDSTPSRDEPEIASLRALTAFMSTVSGPPAETPNSEERRTASAAPALATSVLVGMQPVLTQVPPKAPRSTTATFMPAAESRAARAGPACPVPMMIASCCISDSYSMTRIGGQEFFPSPPGGDRGRVRGWLSGNADARDAVAFPEPTRSTDARLETAASGRPLERAPGRSGPADADIDSRTLASAGRRPDDPVQDLRRRSPERRVHPRVPPRREGGGRRLPAGPRLGRRAAPR